MSQPQPPFNTPYSQPGQYQQPYPQAPKSSGSGLKIVLIIMGVLGILGLLCIGLLIALLYPAVQVARGAAQHAMGMNNVKEVGIAMHNYHDTYNQFPYQQGELGPDGKPLLSWRVHLLPYLGELDLYNQFHLDEPWDSPHNRTLISRMPQVYRIPLDSDLGPGMTQLRAISGPQGVIPEGPGVAFRDIKDGLSNTVMMVVVQPSAAVEWTNPEGFDNNLNEIYEGPTGLTYVGYCDGSVLKPDYQELERVWDAAITRNGGEPVW